MIEKFNKLDNSKKIPIVIATAIVLIIIIILFAIFRNNNTYKIVKEDDSKSIVYTIKSTEDDVFHAYVPHINIKDSSINSINEDIDSYTSDFIDKKMIILSYEYNINGKVLSLVIKTVDYGIDNTPTIYFKSYNINLETKELVSDGELLNIYNTTANDVSNKVEKQFKKWYKDIVKEGYFEEEICDYECFLENREVEDYLEGVAYYIDKGKLVVFKPFSVYSIFKEEDYFKEEDFKFIIAK